MIAPTAVDGIKILIASVSEKRNYLKVKAALEFFKGYYSRQFFDFSTHALRRILYQVSRKRGSSRTIMTYFVWSFQNQISYKLIFFRIFAEKFPKIAFFLIEMSILVFRPRSHLHHYRCGPSCWRGHPCCRLPSWFQCRWWPPSPRYAAPGKCVQITGGTNEICSFYFDF